MILLKRSRISFSTRRGSLYPMKVKVVLIKNVLDSMPLYPHSIMAPTEYTIHVIHRRFVNFFWSNMEEGISRHGQLGERCAYLQRKREWVLDLYLKTLMLCLTNYGKTLGPQELYGLLLCVTNTVKQIHTMVSCRKGSLLQKRVPKTRDEIEHNI